VPSSVHTRKKGKPITDARKFFEIGHHWNGRTLVILSIAQIILGIQAIGYNISNPWLLWLYIAVVICVGVFVLIVEAANCVNPMWDIVPCFGEPAKDDKDYVDALQPH